MSAPTHPELVAPEQFEIERMLGAGEFGVVYRARDLRFDRLVALKLIRPVAESAARERFVREIEALAKLRHPHVVKLLDADVKCATPWLAMELIEGTALDSAPLEPGKSAVDAVMPALLAGLAAAHELGILHRDVKPANILMGARGPVLVDFGLALLKRSAPRLTATDHVVGTPRFLAPELLSGGEASVAADVFAAAATGYWCLTGRLLHDGSDARPPAINDILASLMSHTYYRAIQAELGGHGATGAALLAALHPDPARRTPDALALRRALGQTRGGPRPVDGAATRALPVRARRGTPAGALALAGAALVLMALAVRTPAPAPSPTPVAPTSRATALAAFDAEQRLARLAGRWRQSPDAAWLRHEWESTRQAWLARGPAPAPELAGPLCARDLEEYRAWQAVYDLRAFFADASRQSGSPIAPQDLALLGEMPEAWKGRSLASPEHAAVFALVAGAGTRSGPVPGADGAALEVGWPDDELATLDYRRDRQVRYRLLSSVTGTRSRAHVQRFIDPGPLPWDAPRTPLDTVEIGACVRGTELRDAVDVRFEPLDGSPATTFVLGRFRDGPARSFLRVDGALVPRDARLTVRLHPLPWSAGAGLNLEWVELRWRSAAPAPAESPTARCAAALAHDPVGGGVLLFGGAVRADSGAETFAGDTWRWDGARWTRLAVRDAPPARIRHRMHTDAARGRVVLAGGKVSTGPLGIWEEREEAWEWDGASWRGPLAGKVAPAPGALDEARSLPGAPVLSDPRAVRDAARQSIVLVGARPAALTAGSGATLETWVHRGGVWTRQESASAPAARVEFGLAYDPARKVTVLFGGQDYVRTFADTWEFDGARWAARGRGRCVHVRP